MNWITAKSTPPDLRGRRVIEISDGTYTSYAVLRPRQSSVTRMIADYARGYSGWTPAMAEEVFVRLHESFDPDDPWSSGRVIRGRRGG